MKVCIGSAFPGGLDAEIVYPFEESELFDYYILEPVSGPEHVAQTRRCLCADLVEPLVRRGIDAVVVKDLTPASLFKFASAGVRVFVTAERTVRSSLDLLRDGKLQELGMKDMARLGRNRR